MGNNNKLYNVININSLSPFDHGLISPKGEIFSFKPKKVVGHLRISVDLFFDGYFDYNWSTPEELLKILLENNWIRYFGGMCNRNFIKYSYAKYGYTFNAEVKTEIAKKNLKRLLEKSLYPWKLVIIDYPGGVFTGSIRDFIIHGYTFHNIHDFF